MASKIKSVYVCSSCGYENPKWYGRCPSCGEWDTLEERVVSNEPASIAKLKSGSLERGVSQKIKDIQSDGEHRYMTGLSEFDRVLGGGIVKGSLVLLSGDPGIGKSTILLQVCQYLGQQLKILYVSGEESAHQIKLRADRLGVDTDNLFVMAETDVEIICEHIKSDKPDLVIVDSIQTVMLSELSSSCGSITQVRESTNYIMRTAKDFNIPVIIVGHVNKDGNIAGPKVLEHVVDAVLYIEGERNYNYRILRAVKNRYGSTNEIGVFEMLDNGLHQVENPSMMMLSGRPKNSSGSCVACAMEGSRPILAEVQGLVTPTTFGNPRRMANGFDYNRLSMILAVLEKRCGYFFGNMDVYLNVVGGLKLYEPAADLSVAMALVSSLKDAVVREDVLAFGEIGLAGEVRSVSHCEQRVKEAARLGFTKVVIPKDNLKSISKELTSEIEIIGVKYLSQAFEEII
ncbi:MAG: DNA repair protein RadA [Clostridia bacterium]|nr:DNA repair protein RadA [Candidatus Limimonas egerieequi]MCQ2489329.1 DNA repair protein RadA [Clostridia bacterium]